MRVYLPISWHPTNVDALISGDVSDNDDDTEVVLRCVTLWRNGFSIEGGRFYNSTDPESDRLISEIRTG